MIYVVGVEKTSRTHDYRDFDRQLDTLRPIRLVAGQVLVRSNDLALELYMRLRPHLASDAADKLFIAELTANAIGTFIETDMLGIAQALREAGRDVRRQDVESLDRE